MTSEKIMQKEFKKSETIPVIARVAPIYDAEYTQNLRDRYLTQRKMLHTYSMMENTVFHSAVYSILSTL